MHGPHIGKRKGPRGARRPPAELTSTVGPRERAGPVATSRTGRSQRYRSAHPPRENGGTPVPARSFGMEPHRHAPSPPRNRLARALIPVSWLLAACAGHGAVGPCPDVSIEFPFGESRVDPIALDGCSVLGARVVPDPLAEDRFAVEILLDPAAADTLAALRRENLERAHGAGDRGWNVTLEVRAGALARTGAMFGPRPIQTALWPRPLFLIREDGPPRLHLGWLTREEAAAWVEATRVPRRTRDTRPGAVLAHGAGAPPQ